MERIYKWITAAFFLIYSASGISQPQIAESWVLDSALTGTKEYIARDFISLKKGFKYTPSPGNKFSARIDQRLLFPPAGNTYSKPDGTITDDPALGGVVGAISGTFDVSPTGAAIYSLPIEVLPGIQGMNPNLSLIYNSQSGNGMAGMCWSLGGLSMITRVPKNYYNDNDRSGIIWNNTSPLALDGQRLIVVNAGWGNDSIEYRTESGLDRIVGYNIKSWGPLTFKVYTKDGTIMEYGNTSMVSSYFPIQMNSNNITTASAVYHFGWALTRVIDLNNNFIDFSYASNESYSSGYYNYKSLRAASISYGNHTGGTMETVGKVDFQYIQRTNSCLTYIDGMEMSNQYLLDKIQIRGVNGSLADTYELSYMDQDDNDFLTQIKKVNASGEFILPLQFNWSPMSYPYTFNGNTVFGSSPSVPNPQNTHSFIATQYGDIDGDGLMDLLVQVKMTSSSNSPYYWIVYRNNGDNTYQCLHENSWNNENEKSFLFLDLDGTGDKLYVGRSRQVSGAYGYYLDCYKYQSDSIVADAAGNILIPINSSIYNDRNQLYTVAADFTGEGTTQFLLFKNNNTMVAHSGLDGINLNTFGGNSKSKIFLSDINGNGKTEIAYRNGNNTIFYEYLKGSGFVSILTTNLIPQDAEVQTADFNGDGNTDLLVKDKSSGGWTACISTGSNFIAKNLDSYLSDWGIQHAIILDVNQDGKSDIFLAPSVGIFSSPLQLYISNGTDFTLKIINTPGIVIDGGYKFISNFKTGNSKDVFFSFDTGNGRGGSKMFSLSEGIRFNKIASIKDSFGEQLNISYKDHKNPYAASLSMNDDIDNPDEQMAINNPLPQLEVVSTVTASNTNQSYEYADPRIHRQAKGFLGFSSITATDNLRSITAESESKLNSMFYFLYPYRRTVKTTGGTLINETASVYTTIPTAIQRYFLRLDSVISTDALKGITVKTSYPYYDGERNPQTIKTDYGNGILSTVDLSYVSAGSPFLNRIASRQITQQATGEANVVRKEYFSYDAKGNRASHVIDSTDVNKVQTFYGNYDKYGNPANITSIANGVTRSQTLTYTSFGRLIQTKKNDQLNETVTYYYDQLRLFLTAEANRIGTTTYQYDNFGRLQWTVYPDGIKTASTLQWAGTLYGKPANAKFYSYTETAGQSPVWVWYDAQRREIRRDAYGLNNNKTYIETGYNARGEVSYITEPYFSSKTYAAIYTYDRFGRDSIVVTPMGTTDYDYSGLTATVTTPVDIRKTTINPAGWIVEEETNGKKVNFTHYASGLLKTATPEGGQAVGMEYDLQGNRTKITDPDAGIITSLYDGWGQLTWEKQAIHSSSLITTGYDYHPSGLLNYQLRNGEQTNYGYDNQNRLKWISIAGQHSMGFSYDQYDRLVQSNDTVDGSKVFFYKTEYDIFRRVSKETYPGGYFITNKYDKYGYLTGIVDMNNANIWNALSCNPQGQLTSISQGGRTTSYAYDSRGLPTSMNISGLLTMNYSFTAKGNLDYREDNLSNKESFAYDAMNRLTGWTLYRNNVQQFTNSLAYNSTTGLISSMSNLGNAAMNYGEDGQPPHALTSIAGTPSLIPSTAQSITYTDFKKVAQITEDDNVLDITYGVDEQRVKTVLSNPSDTLTRYYAGNYEEEIRNGSTRKIHYINGGNGLAALYVQNNGNDTIYFVHTDYQGSLLALSLPNGTVERYAYDPWGIRRDPENWMQIDSRNSWIINRGYTMHEHLPEFNLINMNGRVYDPLIAQFLSPDPYIQTPGNWLNYNRFGYALGNPMIYTDPSGEFFFIFPTISWSKSGGLSIGFTAILGIPGIASVQAGVGYSFKSNDFSATIGATAAFNTVYASYSTQSGFSTGWSAGLSPQMGFPISTNFFSMGANYNITHDSWSGNVSAWSVDKNGWTFNPSFSAMIFPDRTTNLVRGQGFRSNDQVLSRFVANGQQQKALDYFGFKGTYDPSIENPGQFDPNDGSIKYNDVAFSKNYDYLRAVYTEELFHSKDYLIYKNQAPNIVDDLHAYEEWRAQMHLYKNQGLYPNSGVDWLARIRKYGGDAGLYGPIIGSKYSYSITFSPNWWHSIYKIPRKW